MLWAIAIGNRPYRLRAAGLDLWARTRTRRWRRRRGCAFSTDITPTLHDGDRLHLGGGGIGRGVERIATATAFAERLN